ncbi:MAG: hypothetical protein ACE5IP_11830 [Terriglobia bacterium]
MTTKNLFAKSKMTPGFPTLHHRLQQTRWLEAIRKDDLRCGDWVLVTTKNSVYSICVLGDDLYSVSGGWFDREGVSPQKTTINGCTWGGSAIKLDIVAACGLFMEFGNKVLTTRIQHVRVLRGDGQRACS